MNTIVSTNQKPVIDTKKKKKKKQRQRNTGIPLRKSSNHKGRN